MQNLTVLNECGFSKEQKERLNSKAKAISYYTDTNSEDLAIERINKIKADVIIMDQFMFTFGGKLLKACPSLKTVIVNTTAFDKIDTKLLKRYNIELRNLPAYATEDVVETALSMILQLNQRTNIAQELVKNGVTDLYPGHPDESKIFRSRLKGQFTVVVGWGKIGSRIGKALKLLGVRVKGLGRKDVESLELLKQADILVIAMAYQPGSNDKIISADVLNSMKKTAIIISIAPSELIDIDWLIAHPNKFSGIGFDYLVTDKVKKLLKLRKLNTIITPHLGSQSNEALKNMTESLIHLVQ